MILDLDINQKRPINAVGKNIIMMPAEKEEKKASVIIPLKEETPKEWEVLSVGLDVEGVQKGDIIYVLPYRAQEVTIDGDKVFLTMIDAVYARR